MVNITEADVGSLWVTRQGDTVRITDVNEQWTGNEDDAVCFELIEPSVAAHVDWKHNRGMRSTCCLDGMYVGSNDCPLDIVERLEFKECPY
jgi:hypothetical protein